MGINRHFCILAFAAACAAVQAQQEGPQYWQISHGDVVDLAPYRFQLPESKAIDLKDWDGQPVLLIYIAAFDAKSTEFAKVFEEKAWPEIQNKNIVCYVVGFGDQIPSLVSWRKENNFSFPIASDSSKKFHDAVCKVEFGGFPHIVMLDRDHHFCVGAIGNTLDPASAEFLKMIDDVIETGCAPAQ